jgi:hypothetical protein
MTTIGTDWLGVLSTLAAEVEEGPLRWASLPPAWLLTVLVIVGFFWIRSLYTRERGNAGRMPRLLLTCIRVLVLLLIVLVLGGPYRQEERRAVERSHLVVLVDTSASMEVKDKYPAPEERKLLTAAYPDEAGRPSSLDGVSRAELVKRVLAPEGEALLRTWAERFVVHAYAFDADWRSLGTTARKPGEAREATDESALVTAIGESIRKAPADGGRTRLGAVLRNVANEFARRQDQHLAGVVLISDGRDTSDGEPPQQVLATMGVVKEKLRVAAIGMGNPASGKNMWVERIRAKDWVLVRDDVVFETALRHTGFNDPHSEVQVTMEVVKVADEEGNPIEPRPYTLPSKATTEMTVADLGEESTPAPVRLRAPFNETGTFQVTIRAKFDGEDDQALDSVPEDDAATHEVRVVDQRIKVLYVDNFPRYDWRFLSTYLTREPGQVQESRDVEARSRFQVSVLLQESDPGFRQPTSLGETPLRHFPRTRSELFAYDVIILGDVDWRRFDTTSEENSAKILELIAEFVEEGGGLALQAGVDYRNPIDFLGTPLAPLLPINVEPGDKAASDNMDIDFRLQLTPAGMIHPIFGVVPGMDDGVATPEWIATTWAGDTELSKHWFWWWLYRARGGLRPGAIDLARVARPASDRKDFQTTRGEPLVVFATMGFGRGQVFWSSLDSISRIRRAQRDRVYGPFWEQVIRYLATYRLLGGNKRYKIFSDKDEYFVGETSTITITALDAKFEPLEDDYLDGVRIEIGDDPTTATGLLLEGDGRPKSMREEGAVGTYRLLLPLKTKGLVRVWIDDASKAGRGSKDRAEKRFEVRYRAREDILKVPDHTALADVMRATNPEMASPEVFPLHQMAEAVEAMQARPRERVLDRRERSQWDKTWVLLLITGLLALEWLLRKRYQML